MASFFCRNELSYLSFRFYRRRLFARCVLVSHFWSFLAPLTPLERPRAQNSVKPKVFLTFPKSLRDPLERLRAAQRCPRGVLLIFARGPERAFGDPKIPHRTPWGPRSGPGGGEQGLRNNKMRIYSGQGFRNEKTLPVATTDTFF